MQPFMWSLFAFVGVVVLLGGFAVGVLWLKRGHRYADATTEWFVLLALMGLAAAFLIVGVFLDPTQLPSALLQVGAGIIAGVVVGVVVLVLQRDS